MVSAYRRLACDPRVTGAVPRNPKGCVAIRVAGRGRRHHALAGLLHGHECRWQAIARDCPAPSWNPALQLRLLRGKAVRPWTRSRPCTPARRRSTPTCATRTRTRTAPSWPRQFGFEVVRVLRVCERLFVSVSGTSPVSTSLLSWANCFGLAGPPVLADAWTQTFNDQLVTMQNGTILIASPFPPLPSITSSVHSKT